MRRLLLDRKRQTGVVDQPLDQFVRIAAPGVQMPPGDFGRIAQQADRALRDHLRGRTVAGIAIALNGRADLAAVRRERDKQQVVEAVLTLLF